MDNLYQLPYLKVEFYLAEEKMQVLNVNKVKEEIAHLEKVLPIIRKLYEEGKSQYFIARQLNESGIHQHNGRHWEQYSISRLIRANSM